MTERVELRFRDRRVDGRSLREFFEPEEITRFIDRPPMVWVRVTPDRLAQLAVLAEHLSYWEYRRHYRPSEIRKAELLQIKWQSFFEPVGEECGTEFNRDDECPECGAGRQQTSNLRLDVRKIPRGAGVASSIASELVVSQSLAEAIVDQKLTGIALQQVTHFSLEPSAPLDLKAVPSGRELLRLAEKDGVEISSWHFATWLGGHASLMRQADAEAAARNVSRAKKRRLPTWYQIIPTSAPVTIVSPTVFGADLFEYGESSRCCSFGHIAGAYLLSELFIDRESWDGSDYCVTGKQVGRAVGLTRPHPLYLASTRLLELLKLFHVRMRVEVAHVT